MQLSQIVCSKNNLFFVFLLVAYLLGVILYDFLGLTYLDEFLTLFLCVVTAVVVWERRNFEELKPLGLVLLIFIVYTLYSFLIHSNTPQAILTDLVIQMKPYLGFLCAYLIIPQFNQRQKRLLSIITLCVGGFLLIVGLVDPYHSFFGHPSRFATACIATAFLFLYCNTLKWGDILCFFLLLAIGFFSTRSKFYGFWAIAVCLILYVKINGNLRWGVRTLFVFIVMSSLAIALAWDKIILYYVDGMMNSREMWSRPAMMLTSGRILFDYFPLGSGLGSFGTFASAEYYSPIYAEYGIDRLWGLSKQHPFFICDAFYPGLAQFGIVGVCLYIAFWFFILKKARVLPIYKQLFVWIIFVFFLIEGIADTTFTHNRGLFVLILLALSLRTVNEVKS